jgi:hypothetical protein
MLLVTISFYCIYKLELAAFKIGQQDTAVLSLFRSVQTSGGDRTGSTGRGLARSEIRDRFAGSSMADGIGVFADELGGACKLQQNRQG